MNRRVLGIVIFCAVFVMAFFVGADVAYAESKTVGKFSYFDNDDGTATIYQYFGDDSVVNIPSEIDGKQVVAVGGGGCILNGPDSCESVKYVSIPEGVKTIGDSAFGKIALSNNDIGIFGFIYIETMVLPSTLETIGEDAFLGQFNLKTIDIPENVSSIGVDAFEFCSSLEAINVDPNNENYCSVDGVLYDKSMETLIRYPECKRDNGFYVPDSVTTIGEGAFAHCLEIKSIYLSDNITSIERCAFYRCANLSNITIPESISTIPNTAFCRCYQLNEINIPSTITSIGDYAFAYMDGLDLLTIPSSVTSIGEEMLKDTDPIVICESGSQAQTYAAENDINYSIVGAENPLIINFPDKRVLLGNYSSGETVSIDATEDYDYFANWYSMNGGNFDDVMSPVTNFVMPEHGTVLVPAYFTTFDNKIDGINYNAIEFKIPENVDGNAITGITRLANGADRCLVRSVYIPPNVLNCTDSAFQLLYDLESIIVDENNPNFSSENGILYNKDGTTLIMHPSVYNTISSDVSIPEGVTTINWCSFYNGNPTSIEIPSSVTLMENWVCPDTLKQINVSEGNSHYSSLDGVLFDKLRETLIVYPKGKKAQSYVVPNGITTIKLLGIADVDSLLSITLPEGLVNMENYTFSACRSLEEINIPSTCQNVYIGMFNECYSLRTIDVAVENENYSSVNGVLFDKNAEKLVLYPCGKLETSYSIPQGVKSIETGAFEYSCLGEINVPDSVTTFGNNAFFYCRTLSEINIPNSITSIAYNVFDNCTSLKNITLPDSITNINDYAFKNCDSIKRMTIPDNVINIGDYCFANCDGLETIIIKENVTTFGDDVFGGSDNLTIYCYDSSPAHTYALNNGLPYDFIGTFNITYNLCDYAEYPAVNADNPTSYTITTQTIVLQPPTRDGFEFAGWYSSENTWDGIKVETIPQGSAGDIELYAHWYIADEPVYSITYDLKDDEQNPASNTLNPTCYRESAATITFENASRDGYTFGGWYTTSECKDGTEKTTIPKGSTGDIKVYAKWIGVADGSYAITYETNGGTNHADNAKTFTADDLPITLKEATRKGYTFDGWFVKDTDTSISTIEKGTQENVSVYAKWTVKNYSIKYNLDGGRNNTSNPATYTIESPTITFGSPSLEGYEFGGWYTSEGFASGTEKSAITNGSTGDVIVWAKWTNDITITNEATLTYDANGGSGEESVTKPAGTSFNLSNGNNFVRTGYVLEGWSSSNSSDTADYLLGALYKMPESNSVLYAVWVLDNDGDGISNDDEVVSGTDPDDNQDIPDTTTLSGKVIDKNNQPIIGAVVRLNSTPRTTTTNASGIYEFTGVSLAPHTLTIMDGEAVLGVYTLNFLKADSNSSTILDDGSTDSTGVININVDGDAMLVEVNVEQNDQGEWGISSVDIEKADSNSTDDTGSASDTQEEKSNDLPATATTDYLWLVISAFVLFAAGNGLVFILKKQDKNSF